MTTAGFPEIYKSNLLSDPAPTGTFNPSSGYFSNESSSYRGGRKRQNKKSNKNKKRKTRKNRTRRNYK